ncbi:MAG: MBL fold metallo-hydrolase [Gammaproteobacteria bacterium]|jgi:glyoxylase-like metal-dependent hydrolase (beta-lactamase superfamily II)
MRLTAAIVALLTASTWSYAQDFSAVEMQTLHVRDNIYMLFGAGGNTTVQAGSDGLLIVDTQFAPLADRLYDAASQLSDGPLSYVINTHMHGDHIGGNARLRQLAPGTRLEPFVMIAHLNAYSRLVQLEREDPDLVPEGGLPVDSFDTEQSDFHFNGEAVLLHYMPNAHTDGDIIVHFRRSDVISTGDVFVSGGYPFIDLDNGGNVRGIIDALNYILALTVPRKTQEGGTLIVPGHGRICDEADVVEFRDMVVIVSERIQDMIDRGMSLRQIQRARPTLDYDTEYVNENSFVSAEAFVEAVYRSLTEN